MYNPSHEFIAVKGVVIRLAFSIGFLLLTFSAPLASQEEEQLLFLRRIEALVDEGQLSPAQQQIEEFLERFPEHAARDKLLLQMGDLCFEQHDYIKGHLFYNRIRNPQLQEACLLKRLHCLYQTHQFTDLAKEAQFHLKTLHRSLDDLLNAEKQASLRFFYAEALFQQALHSQDAVQKKIMLQEALLVYSKLNNSNYARLSGLAIAEIYKAIGKGLQAVEIYQALAMRYPDECDAMLFKAAETAFECDSSLAVALFVSRFDERQPVPSDLSYKWMQLLEENQACTALIASQELLSSNLSKEKRHHLHLYLGKCHLHLNHFNLARKEFRAFLEREKGSSSLAKEALLLNMKENDDLNEIEWTYTQFTRRFPRDPYQAHLLLLYACAEKRAQHMESALNHLEELLALFPQWDKIDQALWMRNSLLFERGFFQQSRDLFLAAVDLYPESLYRASSVKQALNASMQLIRQKDKNTDLIQQLIEDGMHALSLSPSLPQEQLQEIRLLIAEAHARMQNHSEAIALLADYFDNVTGKEGHQRAIAHCLMAAALSDGACDQDRFIFHAEQALSLDSKLSEAPILHLRLYNSYLRESPECDSRAAEHLLALMNEHVEIAIPIESQRWLLQFLCNQAEHDPEKTEKALRILQHLLAKATHAADLEEAIIRVASLLGRQGKIDEEIALLENVKEMQSASMECLWKKDYELLLLLADAYKNKGSLEKSYDIYSHLILRYNKKNPALVAKALLQKSRLAYTLLPKEERLENHPRIQEVLKTLRALQMKKMILAEPLHLESAIDYAQVRASLAPSSDQAKEFLAQLRLVKECFTRQDDIASQDYHASRQLYSEQNEIYQAYLILIEGWTSLLQAELTHAAPQERETLFDNAKALFSHLLSQKKNSPYLLQSAQRGLKRINNSLSPLFEEKM